MHRRGIRGLVAHFVTCLLEEFRAQVPRPVRLILSALALIVGLALAASPLPGAEMIRGDIGFASTDAASLSFRDAANTVRARKARAELRTARGAP